MKNILMVSFLLVFSKTLAMITVLYHDGEVEGRSLQTPNGTTYYAFRGIPYASPPMGSLRFQAPTSPKKWDGILDGTKDSNICYSVSKNSSAESEDCLYLNVYTPFQGQLPVMFLIYGGQFKSGDSRLHNMGPEYFIEQGMVVVTFNYRVGPFGFLSTGDTVIPGNAGLKDQLMALKWVKSYIDIFGGNSTKVTILGQDAGAASVGFHIVSEASKGLFRAAICQSGSALSTWAFHNNPLEYAIKLAKQFNSTISSKSTSNDILKVLSSVSAEEIDEASTKLGSVLPVIEKNHTGAFLIHRMYDVLESGTMNNASLLIGITSEEDILKAKDVASLQQSAENFDLDPEQLIPGNLNANSSSKFIVGQAIKANYVGSEKFQENLGETVKFYSDNVYTRAVIRHAEMQAKFYDVYFYQFSYDGIMGNSNVTIHGADSVGHGEDVKYMIVERSTDYDNSKLENFPEADVLTHNRLLEMWTNFAKKLNPTPVPSEFLQNVTWKKVEPHSFNYLDIGKDLRLMTNPRGHYYTAWRDVYNNWGVKPFTTY